MVHAVTSENLREDIQMLCSQEESAFDNETDLERLKLRSLYHEHDRNGSLGIFRHISLGY